MGSRSSVRKTSGQAALCRLRPDRLLSLRDYPMGTAMQMGPGIYPTVLGGLLVLLGGDHRGSSLRSTAGPSSPSLAPLILLSAAFAFFGWGIEKIGFVPSLLALILLAPRGRGSVEGDPGHDRGAAGRLLGPLTGASRPLPALGGGNPMDLMTGSFKISPSGHHRRIAHQPGILTPGVFGAPVGVLPHRPLAPSRCCCHHFALRRWGRSSCWRVSITVPIRWHTTSILLKLPGESASW